MRTPRLAAATLLTGLVMAAAVPAWAADVTVPTIPRGSSTAAAGDNGGFTTPDPNTPATTTTPPIAGRVKVTGCISSIELATGPLDGQPGPNSKATVAGNGKGIQDFTWPDAGRPVFTSNGRFKATAIAYYRSSGPLGCVSMQDTFVTMEQTFNVAAPPAPPANVRVATANGGRKATVTWDPNTEPDLVGYAVSRSVAGGAACPGTAPAPARTSAVNQSPFEDVYADTDPGGAYCYWVQAVRRGATRDQVVSSAQSPPAPVAMAPSPFATTASSAGSSGTGAGSGASAGATSDDATTNRTAPLPAGAAADTHDFAALLNKAKHTAAAIPRQAGDPDTGFQETLPFQPPPDNPGDTDPAAIATLPAGGDVGINEAGSGRDVGTLTAFASGLVVLVILGLLMLLRREVNSLPLDQLETVEPAVH